jgi:hypothetical protein
MAQWPRVRQLSIAEVSLPVHARYLAKSIDVTLFHDRAVSTGLQRQVFGRDSVMLTLHDDSFEFDSSPSSLALPGRPQGHVVIFNYGAVVFFNVAGDARPPLENATEPTRPPVCVDTQWQNTV